MSIICCSSCGRQWESTGQRREECFPCHLRGIRLGFTYGKEDFHGPTVRERQKSHEAEMTAKGIEWSTATRWV